MPHIEFTTLSGGGDSYAQEAECIEDKRPGPCRVRPYIGPDSNRGGPYSGLPGQQDQQHLLENRLRSPKRGLGRLFPPNKVKRREALKGLYGSGGRIRTYDLWVMSPTSFRCSTPRQPSNYTSRGFNCQGGVVRWGVIKNRDIGCL